MIKVIAKLLVLIRKLVLPMLLAILAGALGFILVFSLSIAAAYALMSLHPELAEFLKQLPFGNYQTGQYFTVIIIAAVFRGLLHYLEQYLNHLIAFKVLADLRVQIFNQMTKLAPAKLDQADKGQLLALITADLELLEVFFAHTISPVGIAVLTSLALGSYNFSLHPYYLLLMLIAQISIAIILPILTHKRGAGTNLKIRQLLGNLSNSYLDQLSGISECLQFAQEEKSKTILAKSSEEMSAGQAKLKKMGNQVSIILDGLIYFFILMTILLSLWLLDTKAITATTALIASITSVTSFLPYINLANLGLGLTGTFACAKRILGLLAEKPLVVEKDWAESFDLDSVLVQEISFGYQEDLVLEKCSLAIKKLDFIGLHGASGSGKSTLAKLIMHFYPLRSGQILLSGQNLEDLKLDSLYQNINYLGQKTDLFVGTIRDNLKIASPNASDEELIFALKEASAYDFLRAYPEFLDLKVSDQGNNFSSGERQRIGLARLFLTDSKLIILDEPSSNLDSYNEQVFLKSLERLRGKKAIFIISHRQSTVNICDLVLKMEAGRIVEV